MERQTVAVQADLDRRAERETERASVGSREREEGESCGAAEAEWNEEG
jgi:hypothetical protein